MIWLYPLRILHPKLRSFLDTRRTDLPRQPFHRRLDNARRSLIGHGLRLVAHLSHFDQRGFAVQLDDRDGSLGACALLSKLIGQKRYRLGNH